MGELTIRREAVQTLTRDHYPARHGDTLLRYQAPLEVTKPALGGVYAYGGQIDPAVVHDIIFTQVRAAGIQSRACSVWPWHCNHEMRDLCMGTSLP